MLTWIHALEYVRGEGNKSQIRRREKIYAPAWGERDTHKKDEVSMGRVTPGRQPRRGNSFYILNERILCVFFCVLVAWLSSCLFVSTKINHSFTSLIKSPLFWYFFLSFFFSSLLSRSLFHSYSHSFFSHLQVLQKHSPLFPSIPFILTKMVKGMSLPVCLSSCACMKNDKCCHLPKGTKHCARLFLSHSRLFYFSHTLALLAVASLLIRTHPVLCKPHPSNCVLLSELIQTKNNSRCLRCCWWNWSAIVAAVETVGFDLALGSVRYCQCCRSGRGSVAHQYCL